jgi:1-acyl-sn-glycerol-3-phosphate acyltransferase
MIMVPWFRLEAYGRENVPGEGAVILAANHCSNLDPPVVAVPLPREVHALAKDELMRIPVFGRVLQEINAIGIQRGTIDRAALRRCRNVLESGGILLVFPEGTRSRDGELQEGRAGVGMIALLTGAPVVPVYIDGTYRAMRRGMIVPRPHKVRVFYGKPFDPTAVADRAGRKERYAAVVEAMISHIRDVKNQALMGDKPLIGKMI